MSQVTRILSEMEQGNPHAADRLLLLVYDELRRLAATQLAREQPGQTLQATALVHDAYLRLLKVDPVQRWESRNHIFAAAAVAMRRILIEAARRKGRHKCGCGRQRLDLDAAALLVADRPADDLVALDRVLTSLARVEPEKATIVELRYFGGLTWNEIAACRGVSVATAKRHWLVARAWLHNALLEDGEELRFDKDS